MQPTTAPTHEPKDDPFTASQLADYDGSKPDKPVYVAIKGNIFDVTPKREMYEPGKGYHIFAGKDGSRGLGMSSLKPEDAVPDYSTLDDKQAKVLDDWVRLSVHAEHYLCPDAGPIAQPLTGHLLCSDSTFTSASSSLLHRLPTTPNATTSWAS